MIDAPVKTGLQMEGFNKLLISYILQPQASSEGRYISVNSLLTILLLQGKFHPQVFQQILKCLGEKELTALCTIIIEDLYSRFICFEGYFI